MSAFHDTALAYAVRLKELAQAVAPETSARVPDALKQPAFVVTCDDAEGRGFVELASNANISQMSIHGRIVYAQPTAHTHVSMTCSSAFESLLFPGAPAPQARASLTINSRWMILQNIAFAGPEYGSRYWADAPFARFTASDVPFRVTASGCMLGLDLLYGHARGGDRQERAFEFLRVFGQSDMLTDNSSAISDIAYRDFAAAFLRHGKPAAPWSFADFLGSLSTPITKAALLLGSYHVDHFEPVAAVLRSLGYSPFQLRDARDLSVQSNVEKLLAGVMCSSVVVVLDDHLSGHVAELSLLLEWRMRPVIVVRSSDRPATSFLEDKIRADDLFRIAVLSAVTRDALLTHLSWARARMQAQVAQFDNTNTWRNR